MMMTLSESWNGVGIEAIAYFRFLVSGALGVRLLGWVLNSSEGLLTHISGGW